MTPLRSVGIAAALMFAALMSACSVIVSPEDEPILCDGDPAFEDPCPIALQCVEGRCQPRIRPPVEDGCVAAEESCNGQDDDCDGQIDDGIDADGDGYTFCGTQRDSDGVLLAGPLLPGFVDCADDDPSTHPGATEICDGIDNDCVTSTPRDPNELVCPSGMVCGERTRSCVDPLDCTEFACAGGTVCDPVTRRCAAETCAACGATERCDLATSTCVPLRADGDGCNVDTECMSGACFDFVQLGATGSHATRGVCSRACCNDGQCAGATEKCFAAQSGARACLPSDAPTTFGLGARANASCSAYESMCSFTFQPRGWCADGETLICDFKPIINCLAGIGSADCGSACESGAVCGAGSDTRCGFVLSQDTVSGVCFRGGPYTDAGGACTSATDCRDGVCLGSVCAAKCCVDADCPGAKCLPAPGRFALMRCQLPSTPPI